MSLLAANAVFRNIYNDNKNINDVIFLLIEEVLHNKDIRCFTVHEISIQLKEYYSFNLPLSIIKKSLKGRPSFKLEYGKYILEKNYKHNKSEKLIEIATEYNSVLKIIKKFIEDKTNDVYTSAHIEKNIIEHLASNKGEFSNLINTCIILNQDNTDFTNSLDNLKSAIVIYTGLSFTPNLHEIKIFKKELTLYLDVEILFNLYGYNGQSYKEITKDLILFVNDINDKSKKNDIIKLKYLSKTKNKIDNFFTSAEHIVNGAPINKPTIAMTSIVNGCECKADILIGKNKFLSFLKERKIHEEHNEFDYSYQNNHRKQLFNESDYSQNPDSHNELNMLNIINLFRSNYVSESLKEAEHLLITQSSKILNISNSIKESDKYYLAANLDTIINTLWFYLSKGLGSNKLPVNFNVVNNARMSLSTNLQKNILRSYDENKNMDNSLLEEVLISFKQDSPESINSYNVESVLDDILNDDVILRRIQEKEEMAQQNKDLKKVSEEYSYEKKKFEASKDKTHKRIESKKCKIKNIKTDINKTRDRFALSIMMIIIIIFITIYTILCMLSKHYMYLQILFIVLGGLSIIITFLNGMKFLQKRTSHIIGYFVKKLTYCVCRSKFKHIRHLKTEINEDRNQI